MKTQNKPTASAILYRYEGTWILEPTHPACHRSFLTGNAARRWAKEHGVTVRRATGCDNFDPAPRVPAPYRIGRNGTGWMSEPKPSKVPGHVSVLLTATGKRGQDVWSERRDVTLAQAQELL